MHLVVEDELAASWSAAPPPRRVGGFGGVDLENRAEDLVQATKAAAMPQPCAGSRGGPGRLLAVSSAISFNRASNRRCAAVCGSGLNSPLEIICVGTGDSNVAASAGRVCASSRELKKFPMSLPPTGIGSRRFVPRNRRCNILAAPHGDRGAGRIAGQATGAGLARAGDASAEGARVLDPRAMSDRDLVPLLHRIADALERLAPAGAAANDLDAADAFVWHAEREWLEPVASVNRVPLALLRGIDRVRDILFENTERFAAGLPANNVLLWGARGMGKSALVKATHAAVNAARAKRALALVEIHREDIPSLPRLLGAAARTAAAPLPPVLRRSVVRRHDASYKSLKAVLEGGIEGRPGNVVLYATSNRRHLMARDMIENERSTAINPSEAVEEKVSLSDRFGLWLGLSQLRPGHLSGDGRRLCRAFRARPAAGRAARGGRRMVDHARRPLGPRRLAVHPGPGRPARQAARLSGGGRDPPQACKAAPTAI